MPENIVHIVATISPLPEHFEDARSALVELAKVTVKEPGCLAFYPVLPAGDGGDICLIEAWRDEAALRDHHEQPYTRKVFNNYESWLAKPVEIRTFSPA